MTKQRSRFSIESHTEAPTYQLVFIQPEQTRFGYHVGRPL